MSTHDFSKDQNPEAGKNNAPDNSPSQHLEELHSGFEERRQARVAVLGLTASVPNQDSEPTPDAADIPKKSHDSIMRRRWRKFKSLKRGYISFILLIIFYVLSFFLPLFINNKPVFLNYEGEYYFPAFADLISTSYYPWSDFGREGDESPVDFRELALELEGSDESSIIMPFYTWDPYENDYQEGVPPNKPSSIHIFGTDDIGRDVFSRMCYGFNISISFGLILTLVTFALGTFFGALMGYFGGKFDLFFQRGIEIWQTLPAFFVIIIVSSIIIPNFFVLMLLLAVFGWMGMTYFMRGEFYREKARDYVAAAISLGTKDSTIIFKHILPNSLTPLIATFPFAVVAGITSLVSLDFLGYGLPPPTPSWGQMIDVGLANFSGNFQNWWLIVVPVSAMFITLLMVTFIGEAIREAFDPKVFSRLR